MANNRPLSPHLQIYKLPITGLISISHRITGIFLSVGLFGLIWLVMQVKSGMLDYLAMQTLLQSLPAKIVLVGFIFAFMFHLCHGTRHLIWDMGKTFNTETLTRFAQIELLISLFLTVSTLAFIL